MKGIERTIMIDGIPAWEVAARAIKTGHFIPAPARFGAPIGKLSSDAKVVLKAKSKYGRHMRKGKNSTCTPAGNV
jgi:hypothetical protein